MTSKLVSRRAEGVVAAALLVFGVLVISSTWLGLLRGFANHDVAAYLNGTRLWQRGARLYEDFLEINPVAVFVMYLPGVWLSRLRALSLREGLYAWVTLLAILSALGVMASLRRARDRFAHYEVALVVGATLYAGFRMVATDFGQRDHLVFLLSAPYVVQIGLMARGTNVAMPLRTMFVLAMAIAILLKPHYLLLWLAVELYLSAAQRSPRTLFRAENWLLGALVAVATVTFLVGFPGYLRNVVPMVMDSYHAYDANPFWSEFRVTGVLLAGMAAVAGLAHGRNEPLIGTLFAATCACVLTYWLQGKGWTYHARPLEGFAVMLLAAAAGLALKQVLRGQGEPWVRYAPLVFASIVLVARVESQAVYAFSWSEERLEKGKERQLLDAFLQLPAGSTVLALTSENLLHPPVLHADLIYQSSFPCYWTLPAVYQGMVASPLTPLVYPALSAMGRTERETARRMLFDLARRPTAIVFDLKPRRELFGRSGFRWPEYVRSFPEVSEVLDDYRRVLNNGRYELWLQRSLPK